MAHNVTNVKVRSLAGVGMSGTLVHMGIGLPAGTLQKYKILGSAGYRVPRKF